MTAITWTRALTAAGLVLVAGCGSAAVPSPATAPSARPTTVHGVAAHEPSADARPYGAADTAFGLDVLHAWCTASPQSNIVFSPESLASGLGMAYLGARGATAQAMAKVLHLPAAGAALTAGLHARSAALGALSGPGVSVAAADRLWSDPSLPATTSYLNALATGYGAGVSQVPLRHDPASAAQTIDAAISAATRGHIPQLLSPDELTDTGWVLTDALYMDAKWAHPFDPADTSDGAFTTAAGSSVTARFMKGAGGPVAQAGGWTAVSLPYQGGKLAMVALLPDSGAGGCPDLPAATLTSITASLARGGAGNSAVMFPKVSLKSTASLKGLLTTLGMGPAFSPEANFGGLSPAAGPIGTVVHAATLDVGEKGTVGSAATAVGIRTGAVAVVPKLLTFNRPYLMMVTDTATGEPLFMARVATAATG